MDVQLSAEAQRYIEAQLQLGRYRSASKVIEALVESKNASKGFGENSAFIVAELAARQRLKLLQVIQECEALSTASDAEKFSHRNHDQFLYDNRL